MNDERNSPDNSFAIALTDSASMHTSEQVGKEEVGEEVQGPRTRSKGRLSTQTKSIAGTTGPRKRKMEKKTPQAGADHHQNATPARSIRPVSPVQDNPKVRTRASSRTTSSIPTTSKSKTASPIPCAKKARNASVPHAPLDMRTAVLVARDWIINATMNPKCRESMEMRLRPSVLKAMDFITFNIENAAQMGNGANNSLLLMGARGSGKTITVERALYKVASKFNGDGGRTTTNTPFMGIVRLYGNVHNDERVAFREIASQLCDTFGLKFVKTASLGENISFLNQILLTLQQAQKFLCFVLEDFDMFAHRNKQTLLYCLLDALQKSRVKASVIGTTTRHDCIDLLEKRVKSRFSHRTYLLHPPKYEKWKGTTGNDASQEGECGVQCQGGLEVLQDMLTLPEQAFPDAQHAALHNEAVARAIQHSSTLPALKKYVESRSSLHDLRNVAVYIANHMWCQERKEGRLKVLTDVPTEECISQACFTLTNAIDRGMQSYIAGLSIVELLMLAACYRAAKKRNEEAINFEMAYQEFAIYCASGDHVDNYSKSGGFRAFERLIEVGLVTFATGVGLPRVGEGPRLRNYTPVHLQVRYSELVAGLADHTLCPARLKEWAIREGGPLVTVTNMLMS